MTAYPDPLTPVMVVTVMREREGREDNRGYTLLVVKKDSIEPGGRARPKRPASGARAWLRNEIYSIAAQARLKVRDRAEGGDSDQRSQTVSKRKKGCHVLQLAYFQTPKLEWKRKLAK